MVMAAYTNIIICGRNKSAVQKIQTADESIFGDERFTESFAKRHERFELFKHQIHIILVFP